MSAPADLRAATHLVSATTSPCGDGYRVAWSINPHMRPGRSRLERARAQHRGLCDALTEAGARIAQLPFVPRAYDCVFVKDCAVLQRDGRGRVRALLARARCAERAPELAARGRWLRARYVRGAPCPVPLEGGDVARVGDQLVLGHGFRSDPRAAEALARFSGRPVLPVRLTDPHLYHLDTALAHLDGGELLVAEGAIAPRDLGPLTRLPAVREVIRVPRETAHRFALNLVQVGRRVLMSDRAPSVAAALRTRGYAPKTLPLDQFHLAGGSAACLVAPVHPPPSRAVATVSSPLLEVSP